MLEYDNEICFLKYYIVMSSSLKCIHSLKILVVPLNGMCISCKKNKKKAVIRI